VLGECVASPWKQKACADCVGERPYDSGRTNALESKNPEGLEGLRGSDCSTVSLVVPSAQTRWRSPVLIRDTTDKAKG